METNSKIFNLKFKDGNDFQLSVDPFDPLEYTNDEWDGKFDIKTKDMTDDEYREYSKNKIIENGLSEGRLLLEDSFLMHIDNPYCLNIIEAKKKNGLTTVATNISPDTPELELISLIKDENINPPTDEVITELKTFISNSNNITPELLDKLKNL